MPTIAIIAADYPPMLGGISRYTGDVVLFLSRILNVRVYICTDSPPPIWGRHPHAGLISKSELDHQPDTVAGKLKREGIEHVIFNFIDLAGPRTILSFRKNNLPCSTFIYGADINFHRSLRGHARLYATAALMKRRIVISEGTRKNVHRRLPGLSTEMVLPGIELADHETPRTSTGEGILAVGRFVRRKGFDTLLDAAAILQRDGLHTRLTLAGDGPDREWLMRRIEELGLQKSTRIISGLTDEEINTQLHSHRVFCLLPRSLGNGDVEGFGIVFLEAARAGLPVVAGNSGGVPDAVLDNGNGFLVDPNRAEDAARRLRTLLSDDVVWHQQSRTGLDWYRKFAWSLRDPKREFAFLGQPATSSIDRM